MRSERRRTSPPSARRRGSIYDLGYRHYEGERRGRRYATWSLYVESLRGVFGFGRPVTAKAAPFILLGLYAFFAIMQLAFSSFLGQAIEQGDEVELFAYDNYFMQFWIFVLLFVIAQAPELVCRDQRYHVLPLYFTRSLHRLDYVLAKLAALTSALFILLILPMVALFVGDVLMQQDAIKAVGRRVAEGPPGSAGLPADGDDPGRHLAGLVVLLPAPGLFRDRPGRVRPDLRGRRGDHLGGRARRRLGVGGQAPALWAVDLADRLHRLLLRRRARSELRLPATLGADAYLLSSLACLTVFAGVLLFRYRRLAA